MILFGVISIVLILYSLFPFLGMIVVRDLSGKVSSAAVVAGDGKSHPLRRLPGDVFVGIAKEDGEVEIRCPSGSPRHAGYVTPHADAWFKVEADEGCGRITGE